MISAENRDKTEKIIKKRIKQLQYVGSVTNKTVQRNRLSKSRAFGCKRANCHICRDKKTKHPIEYIK